MARRMFSTEIIDSDSFLEMGASARLLYYDLGVRADNDGFITPLKVLRITGASTDDLKVLNAKGYIHEFEDGVIVIRQWLINNNIPSDKYTPSIYNERLQELVNRNLYSGKLPSGRPKKDSFMEPLKVTEKGSQVRLGKVSIISKSSIDRELKLSNEELNLLKEKFPGTDIDTEYEKAQDWLASTGKTYKDYQAFFRGWLRRIKGDDKPVITRKRWFNEEVNKWEEL